MRSRSHTHQPARPASPRDLPQGDEEDGGAQDPRDRRIRLGLSALFVFGLLITAWVHDDAYISFRSVRNLVEGRGLTWNPGERVQVFTHPLWFFLHAALFALTREVYFTTLSLGLLLSSLVVFLTAYRLAPSARHGVLALAALLLSQGFLDYSTSGLENPLTHLLIVLLAWRGWSHDGQDGRLLPIGLLTALAALNRLDTLALLLPGFALLAFRKPRTERLRALFVLVLPILAWELFSLVYFGFLVPNTAPAKLATGVSHLGKLLQAGYFVLSSLSHDGFTLLFGSWLLVAALRSSRLQSRAAALGVLGHLLYLAWIGGDYMSGRFWTAPYLLLLLAWLADAHRPLLRLVPWAAVAIGALALRTLVALSGPAVDAFGIGDERRVWHPYTGLVYVLWENPWPEQRWRLEKGVDCDPATCVVVRPNIGLHGYQSGPDVVFVDRMALPDPFRARLPGRVADHPHLPGRLAWRPGHVERPFPAGFLESIASGDNRLEDRALAELYDAIQTVDRGTIFSLRRWREIWKLHTGAYDFPPVAAEETPRPWPPGGAVRHDGSAAEE